MKLRLILFFVLVTFYSFAQNNSILVFSKTAGFRHESIKEGIAYFEKLSKTNGFKVKFSENAADINETELKKHNAVVFLNTTGDILNAVQEVDFERYIQAGGGFVGIHAATDCEYNWTWYTNLVGGQFASHPGGEVSNVQQGEMTVLDKTHPSTTHMPEKFSRTDEFYDFKNLKKEQLKFLLSVDEKTYKMGQMGDFHPMAWYHDYDGGKAFYSNFGHTNETFSEPLMIKHFEEGLKSVWAKNLDYSKSRTVKAPEENRFEKTTLVKGLDEPTELAVMPNGKVMFVERKGALKVWNPKTNVTKKVGQLDVYNKFEYGLMGVGLDPKFDINNWFYVYYTPTTDQHTDNFLSRFTYDQVKDTVLYVTEKVVLRVKVKRDECCHTGGSIDWDSKGNLFVSTGDDTNPFASDGYAPIDFRADRRGWDALSTSGNTNDLRGKILRIKPQDDGTYTIPDGNLFAKGTDKTRPEIFVMGNRNPYRISVDKTTDYLYWGEVGPDAGKTNPSRGPEGIVEFNQARKAGFFGWPIFTGDNFAYNAFDFETNTSGPKFDAAKPMNNSTHNTGIVELPAAQKPMIWYGYGESAEYPLLGKGGANPMGGPVYHSNEYKNAKGKFPSYFDNKFFTYEWMRDWVILVSLDKNGNYAGMEQFMPSTKFYHPMDMAFSQDGVLYVLEYGMNWFAQNEEAMLSKIEFNGGNRKPVVKLLADKTEGAAPLNVTFSSAGTLDYDSDKLSYSWTFGKGITPSNLANPKVNFTKPGIYDVKLSVNDGKGNKTSETIKIKVGNAIPEIEIKIKSNNSFVVDNTIEYEVQVKDKEDGSTRTKTILPEDVMVSIDYVEGFDKTMLEQGHKANESFMVGKRLIEKNDCASCHSRDKKSIGPSYTDIAGKYKPTNQNYQYLTEKIIAGGGGVWGEQAMAAHPSLASKDAREIVEYILKINDKVMSSKKLEDTFKADAHTSKKEGAYVIRASYTDKGGKVVGPISTTKSVTVNSPQIKAVNYDQGDKVSKFNVAALGDLLIANDNGFVMYKNMDLRGVNKLTVNAFGQKGSTFGGTIEIRLGSKTGLLLGSMEISETGGKPETISIENKATKPEDLYLLFNNKNAEGKSLFGLTQISFGK
jgi:cytochrome c